MADSSTTNYGLVKPENTHSNSTWGTKTNANWDSVDALIKALNDNKQDILVAATVAEIWSAAAAKYPQTDEIATAQVFTAMGNQTGNVTLDLNTGINFSMAATGNITFNAIAHAKEGTSGMIQVTHSGGARTLTLNGTFFTSPGKAGISLSTNGAGTIDLLAYVVLPSGKLLIIPSALNV